MSSPESAFAPGGLRGGLGWTTPSGTPTEVKLPDNDLGRGTGTFTTKIRDGWIGGSAAYADTGQPASWNLRAGQAHLIDTVVYPTVTNARGWLVGEGGAGMVLAPGKSVVDLPLPGPRPNGSGGADALSDDGRIVASEYRNPAAEGTSEAMLWRCSSRKSRVTCMDRGAPSDGRATIRDRRRRVHPITAGNGAGGHLRYSASPPTSHRERVGSTDVIPS